MEYPKNTMEQFLFQIKCYVYFGILDVNEIQAACEEALQDRIEDLKHKGE